jgi:hypothetical protein
MKCLLPELTGTTRVELVASREGNKHRSVRKPLLLDDGDAQEEEGGRYVDAAYGLCREVVRPGMCQSTFWRRVSGPTW